MRDTKPTIDDMISSVIDDKARADVIKSKISEEEKTKRERAPYQTGMTAIVCAAVLLVSLVAWGASSSIIEARSKRDVDLVTAQQPRAEPLPAPTAWPSYTCSPAAEKKS